jgi:hypothetical protein
MVQQGMQQDYASIMALDVGGKAIFENAQKALLEGVEVGARSLTV